MTQNIPFESKTWTIKMNCYARDMAVTQAYLEYGQDHPHMKLEDFRLKFGNTLARLNTETSQLTREARAVRKILFCGERKILGQCRKSMKVKMKTMRKSKSLFIHITIKILKIYHRLAVSFHRSYH